MDSTTTPHKTEYNDISFETNYPDGIENDFWNLPRNKVIVDEVAKLANPNILDVGCGRGIVTASIHKAGYKIRGVELGIARPITKDVDIYYATDVFDLPSEIKGQINTVTLFDVIEHIETPEAFIKNIIKAYPSVHTVIVTVPAREELWSNYDVNYGHYRRYTLDTIEKCMNDCGLKVQHKQYFFHVLYIMLYINKQLNRNRNTILKAPEGVFAKWMHKLIGACLYVEAKILPKWVYGTSVICVATVNK